MSSTSPWKWVAIGASIIVMLSCGLCVAARFACSRAEDAIATTLTEAAQSPSAPSAPVVNGPFDALASQLRIGEDYREGPGADFVADAGFADEYTGAAIRVFYTEAGLRIAFLQADRTLRDMSRSEREAWVRGTAQELESMFPNAGILFAVRGRVFFGASAMKLGAASSWQFQAGTTIDKAAFDSFFVGALPRSTPTLLGEEAHQVTGEFDVNASVEPDCVAYPISLRPTIRIQLPVDRPRLSLEVQGPETGVGIVVRRPDGIMRCEIEFERVALEGSFPPGTYDVWVGASLEEFEEEVESREFTLTAQATP